jgi:pyruvate,water dikinase
MEFMGAISNLLKIFVKKQRRDPSDIEALRNAFKSRYHHFKLLLNANNEALDIMAEMEEALKGNQPLGMTFVRSHCTRVSTNVFQIVKHLNELALDKYDALYGRFKEIQKKINPFISAKNVFKEGPLVLPLEEVDKNLADQVGSKMANLGEIKNRIHLKVSNGFVITAQAFQRFMEHNDLQAEIDRRIQATSVDRLDQLYSLSAAIQQLITRSHIPEDLEAAIGEQYKLLEKKDGSGITVAMRSSALGEDLADTSFAGQYRSQLNVNREHILDAYKEIVASKYSLQAITYRLNRGIRDEDVAMCVGCMSMVDAASGGVIYSRSPLDIRDSTIVINSVWGLPKPVVDGSSASDLFLISQDEPIEILKKEIPSKDNRFVCYPDEGICRMDMTGDKSCLPSLSDDKALELSRLALQLEGYYGTPQDIEWAVDTDGAITILQCRPLKQRDVGDGQGIKEVDETVSDSIVSRGGVTASPGVGSGPVFIVKKDVDALQFPDGGILVTSQSLPRWATLLNRAAAVVTEKGGIAGHLANVAREFGVPALFGVNEAVTKLKNGQPITVDADGLRIYNGYVTALLRKRERPKNLMAGSPVLEALKGAAQHIIPLNLLDPNSPYFRPNNCKTFHDITRFCHEKVVEEMFRFGKDHHFPERSSKQLVCDVPMQWWVLNLDDGFREEVEGKYVQLENIVSIPMLAIWEGITVMPWGGPPPVDGKGFMSVMFQATTNTSLVPGLRSRLGDRNYFMISKNYCSLNSRLGFHFSTIETLVSDRPNENYISFQFKGGAADDTRKHKRVLFVRDILEEHGFRVEVKEDNLMARLEDREKDFMKKRLKVLGYLSIHTRQLDMIMSSNASVEYYRSKINKDIHDILRS